MIHLLLPLLENKESKKYEINEKYTIITYFINQQEIERIDLDLVFDLLNDSNIRYKIVFISIFFEYFLKEYNYVETINLNILDKLIKKTIIIFEELKNIDYYINKKYYIDKLFDDNGIFNNILTIINKIKLLFCSPKIDEQKEKFSYYKYLSDNKESVIVNIECLINNFVMYFDCIESKIDEITENKNIEFFRKFLEFYSKLLKNERDFNHNFPIKKDLIKSNFTEDKFISFLKNEKIVNFILHNQQELNINHILNPDLQDIYEKIVYLYRNYH